MRSGHWSPIFRGASRNLSATTERLARHSLTKVLETGLRTGVITFAESAKERARVLIGSREGAMLVECSYGNLQRFQAAAAFVLADLGAHAPVPKRRTTQA
jgi:hypothetical protein